MGKAGAMHVSYSSDCDWVERGLMPGFESAELINKRPAFAIDPIANSQPGNVIHGTSQTIIRAMGLV
jgi:hypothetical protein